MSIIPNVADRIKEITITQGTGSIVLAGAEFTFKAFSSSMASGTYVPYAIVHETLDEWEVGYGRVGNSILARTQVYSGSNGSALVNFSSGSKNVFCTYPAAKSVMYDLDSTTLNIGGTPVAIDSPTQMNIMTLATGSSTSIQDFKSNGNGPGIAFVKSKSGIVGTKFPVGINTDLMAFNLWGIADDSSSVVNAGEFSFNTTFTSSSRICGEYRWWNMNTSGSYLKQMSLSSEGFLAVSGGINTIGNLIVSGGVKFGGSGSAIIGDEVFVVNTLGQYGALSVHSYANNGNAAGLSFLKSRGGSVGIKSSVGSAGTGIMSMNGYAIAADNATTAFVGSINLDNVITSASIVSGEFTFDMIDPSGSVKFPLKIRPTALLVTGTLEITGSLSSSAAYTGGKITIGSASVPAVAVGSTGVMNLDVSSLNYGTQSFATRLYVGQVSGTTTVGAIKAFAESIGTGSITTLTGGDFAVEQNSTSSVVITAYGNECSAGIRSGSVTNLVGLLARTYGIAGATSTTAMGINVFDITTGASWNRAIKTGLGPVELGDSLYITGSVSASIGLAVKTSGSASRIGRATMSAGTIKVSNTSVQVQTDVFITNIKLVGSGSQASVSRSFGDGFTISGSTADNSTYSWMLVDEY